MSGGFLSNRHLIVGIDPGSTVGVALLDLTGGKLACLSFEGGGIAEASRVIERHGTPSLVACDVTPPPEMALRLASYFSCRLFVPQRQIREADKRAVASGAGVKNSHERDAYCAAVYAYRASANKLRQIDALTDVSSEDRGRLKHLLLKGYRLQDAFIEIAERGAAPIEERKAGASKAPAQPLAALQGRVSSLARENANLRLMVGKIEEEKRALLYRIRLLENGVLERVLREGEVRRLRHRVGQLLRILEGRKRAREKTRANEVMEAREGEKTRGEGKPGEREAACRKGNATADGGGKPKNTAALVSRSEKEGFCDDPPSDGGGLNNLGDGIDLEKIVAEYRKGRA